jgi:RHS repeat-associated protein
LFCNKTDVPMAELCLLTELTCLDIFRSWLLGDHLGSTSMVANASGAMVSEMRYSAFGEIRYDSGTMTTDYLYTGQRQEAEIGLYYYLSRWYDPAIGRFLQADSIVPNPGIAVGLDRYAYGFNNPLRYVDPTGHTPICLDGVQCVETEPGAGSISSSQIDGTGFNYSHYPTSLVRDGQDPFLEEHQNPASPSLPPLNPQPKLAPPVSGEPVSSYGPIYDLEVLLLFIQHVGLNLVNQFGEGIDAVNAAKLIRGGWKMGRASLPMGATVEGGVSGVLQFVIDSKDPALASLSTGQKVGRAFVVAAETGLTDVAANAVGGLLVGPGATAGSAVPVIGTAAGGFIGYQAGSIPTTLAADAVFSKVNSWLFPSLGWGGYP